MLRLEKGKPVSALKRLIKAAKQNEFDHIDANILDLYQVEIPITDDETPQNPDLGKKTKLQVGEKVSGSSTSIVATTENPLRTATKRMRDEGLGILNRRWSKKPAMEISVSKSFADRKEAARVDAKDFTPDLVLSMSFEGLQPSDLTSCECGPEFERNFQNNLTRSLLGFYKKYLKIRMMIIVDEYDSSVNSALLSPNADCFRKYLKARSCRYFRFFTLLKQALRVVHNHALVVGVTPLAVSDFTSGFNISFDMTWDSGFQDVCGIAIDDIEPVFINIGRKYRWDVKTKGTI
ncbi:hypothetical protein EV426DRAFT_644320 [Tirmania nivea]|nr:hypothetical protein EV426DRAFT_644320 [Tirmania nivea]